MKEELILNYQFLFNTDLYTIPIRTIHWLDHSDSEHIYDVYVYVLTCICMVPNKKEYRAIHIHSVGKDLASLLKLEWLTFVVNGILVSFIIEGLQCVLWIDITSRNVHIQYSF